MDLSKVCCMLLALGVYSAATLIPGVKMVEEEQPVKPMRLGKLNINRAGVATAGCSHAGDFAHQFHIAFSSIVKGACVFSGQPYHCAVTRFAADQQVVATPESSVPRCDGCDMNRTLVYDHCKNHPQWVDVGKLPDYVRRACGQNPISPAPHGCIDDPTSLFDARVFLFHPTHDRCYLDGSVANTQALYYQLLSNPKKNLKFVNNQPFPHCLPTNSTPFFNTSKPSGYDGPGECLQWLYGHDAPLKPVLNWTTVPGALGRNAFVFDQQEFIAADPELNGTGIGPAGVIYIPDQCKTKQIPCHLLLLTNGCHGSTTRPGIFGGGSGSDWDFARWAESNNIVLLRACVGGPVDTERFPNSYEVQRGLLDVYGQLSDDYALQSGFHMRFVGSVLRRVLDGEQELTLTQYV